MQGHASWTLFKTCGSKELCIRESGHVAHFNDCLLWKHLYYERIVKTTGSPHGGEDRSCSVDVLGEVLWVSLGPYAVNR